MRDYSAGIGSKIGSGGMASASQANAQRRERLRQLARETIDLKKDPYFMKNHIGKYECKLCLTLHTTEGSYLAHTQGKRHQENLARRAARVASRSQDVAAVQEKRRQRVRKTVKIGRPGYKVVKQYDPATRQRCLLFQISYPKIADGVQPRHRFMSAFEQRVENPNDSFQYILFAADPYETIAFKIPNRKIDRSEGKFFSQWDPERLTITVQLFFEPETSEETM